MDEQTAVFDEMTTILAEVTAGADPKVASEALTVLGERLKQLKIRLADLKPSYDGGSEDGISDRPDFIAATAAYQMAQQQLFMSGNLTPEINQALKAHSNPAPMNGEGSPQ